MNATAAIICTIWIVGVFLTLIVMRVCRTFDFATREYKKPEANPETKFDDMAMALLFPVTILVAMLIAIFMSIFFLFRFAMWNVASTVAEHIIKPFVKEPK